MSMKILPALLALAVTLPGSAFAQMDHSAHGTSGASSSPSTAAFEAADKKMMQDMSIPYTGDADVDFRAHMIPHHQGAIDIAKVALEHAKDPETKKLAEKIIADQEREIAEMKDWLAKHKK
ncbi:DUF305 domain-containing protein [Flaviflagellibacter deserti]|uniref:DUF305 domain-containing protein n=1 Tax=Flaviflagellibacter deserti TaxID=2267266 RepID=A0ABV9Z0B3_9HYPH